MVKNEVHGDDGCLVESLSGLKGKPDRKANNCAATNIPNQFVTKIVVLHLGEPILLNYPKLDREVSEFESEMAQTTRKLPRMDANERERWRGVGGWYVFAAFAPIQARRIKPRMDADRHGKARS